MQADLLRRDAALPAAARADATALAAGLQHAIAELRDVVEGVMPALLDRARALRGGRGARGPLPDPGRAGCRRRPRAAPGDRWSARAYFIVAEALTNAVKHSRATAAALRIARRNGHLRIELRDDGVGGADAGGGTGTARSARPRRGARRPADRAQPAARRHADHRGAPMRVVIGEDHALMREGMVLLLERAGFEVAGVAAEAEDLVRKARAHRPDVVIADVRMPPSQTDEGLQAALEIRAAEPGHRDRRPLPARAAALRVRAAAERRGRGRRRLPPQAARRRRRRVLRRRAPHRRRRLRRSTPRSCARCSAARARDPLARLTERQREVLGLMAEGRSNAGIAERLFLTERAVVKHVSHVYDALGIAPCADDHRRVLAVVRYMSR